jgi:hypothetical protein
MEETRYDIQDPNDHQCSCDIYLVVAFIVLQMELNMNRWTPSPNALLMIRIGSASLLALGGLSWLGSNIAGNASRRPIMITFLAIDMVGIIWIIMGINSMVMDFFGWSVIVILLLLGLGFGYMLFAKLTSQ